MNGRGRPFDNTGCGPAPWGAGEMRVRQLPVKACAKGQEVFLARLICHVISGLEWTFGITRTSGSKRETEKVEIETEKCKMGVFLENSTPGNRPLVVFHKKSRILCRIDVIPCHRPSR